MQTHSHSADLTTPQACDLYEEICGQSVDRATITRWVANGTLTPSFKFPGRTGGYLFRRADVERLAAERAEQSA